MCSRETPGENKFAAIRVNEDNWELKTCPMCGPELTVTPGGPQLCAFMSRHKVYWSVSDDRVTGFTGHAATPANENDEIYPTAIANRRGEVLFAWQVGPMSTTGTATVKWACYTLDGRFTGRAGSCRHDHLGHEAGRLRWCRRPVLHRDHGPVPVMPVSEDEGRTWQVSQCWFRYAGLTDATSRRSYPHDAHSLDLSLPDRRAAGADSLRSPNSTRQAARASG